MAKSTASPQTNRAGQPQRLLFRARSRHRQEHRHARSSSKPIGRRAWTPKASPSRIRPRSRRPDGALVSPNQGGAANWPPPSFSPRHGTLLRQCHARLQRVLHLRSTSEKPEGWGGNDRGGWARIDAAGDRLQNRQDPLEPQMGRRRRTLRRPEHRRQSGVHRRHGNNLVASTPRPVNRSGTPISGAPSATAR